MKKTFILLAMLLGQIVTFGQAESKAVLPKRNTVYFEVFGQGLYNSFSYDRLYRLDKKVKTSFTAGLTLIPARELFVLGAPVSYNFIFGQKNHHLELGLGFTLMYLREGRVNASEGYTDQNGVNQTYNYLGHSNNFYSFFTPKIGYRFQKPTGGFFMRVALTPPIAGINRLGGMKGGKYDTGDWTETQYFSSAAFFESYKIFPWAGISFGYTLK